MDEVELDTEQKAAEHAYRVAQLLEDPFSPCRNKLLPFTKAPTTAGTGTAVKFHGCGIH